MILTQCSSHITIQSNWNGTHSAAGVHFIVSLYDFSYQVPKEVGKIGTESPTYIEPVAARKDGIQAMFAKQRQTKPSPAETKVPPPQSTKRDRTPVAGESDGEPPSKRVKSIAAPSSPKKQLSKVR